MGLFFFKGSEMSNLNSTGKLFQKVGALTAEARSPLVFSLDQVIGNRALSEALKLRAGE